MAPSFTSRNTPIPLIAGRVVVALLLGVALFAPEAAEAALRSAAGGGGGCGGFDRFVRFINRLAD